MNDQTDTLRQKTFQELLIEAQRGFKKSEIQGEDRMAAERFAENVRHMLVFDVLSEQSHHGFKGDRIRVFLSEEGYRQALAAQKQREVKIQIHAKVASGNLYYDRKERER